MSVNPNEGLRSHARPGAYLVTGGGGAIGQAIVATLLRRGASRVYVADVNGDAARLVAASLSGDALVLDVADPASTAAAARQLRESGDRLSGLVNCAAIIGSYPGARRLSARPRSAMARVARAAGCV
jgi:NAD(P)-dependent dehydrogenase (short-subunit alcohol dehydrogenase family)